VAEFVADLVHRFFEPLWPPDLAVEQGRRISHAAIVEMVGANPDQSKPGYAVGFASEQAACGMKQCIGQLGRIGYATRAGAQAEIGGFELQSNRPGR
jgi:hypothetical protein